MTNKRVNLGYLLLICVVIAINKIPAIGQMILEGGLVVNILVSEGLVVLPMFLITIASGEKLSTLFPFHKIRITSVLWLILFTYLMVPFTAFLNSLSLLFTSNTVLQMSGEIVSGSPVVMLLMMAVVAPLCEELVFRGIVYGTYRKSGNLLKAVILSALLFGLMHMNFNQAIYAFAIGIIMVLMVEATGSLWASLIFHVIFNANSVVTLFTSSSVLGDAALQESAETAISTGNTLYMVIGVYFVISLITVPIGFKILGRVSRNEGKEGYFGRILESRHVNARLVTIPLILAIILALGFMTCLLLGIGF